MAIDDIKTFHRDDEGYLEWVATHSGYVLTERDGGKYMLHEAECSHLEPFNIPGPELTRRPRRWAVRRQDLSEWAELNGGARPLLCQSCM